MRKSPKGDTIIRSGFRRRDHSEPLSQIRNLSALRMKTLRHPIDSPQNVIFVRFSGERRQVRGRKRVSPSFDQDNSAPNKNDYGPIRNM